MKRSDLPLSMLTKEQLIERIQQLENSKTLKKVKKAIKDINFDEYPSVQVVLKLCYFGWNYNGFASQQSYKPDTKSESIVSNVVTIEDELFKVLMNTRLISSPTTCNYSRCGRTDSGVSSTGQIISLKIRSSSKKLGDSEFDLPIASLINRQLPKDIRILDYAIAPENFNARFDCKYREYKYFFAKRGLNVEAMNLASKYLVGLHNFQNYSKRDPSKNVENFERKIIMAEISNLDDDFCVFTIRGTAFLYHQVRCIMAVLFQIGKGQQPPEYAQDLLDLSKYPNRPEQLKIAPEIPLVLYDCGYETDFEWRMHPQEKESILRHFKSMWCDLQFRSKSLELLPNLINFPN